MSVFKTTTIIFVAVMATQGLVSLFFPVPYGMKKDFFTISAVASLVGIYCGAMLGSWGFFRRRPEGLVGALSVIGVALIVFIYCVMKFYNLYHMGGVPENFHVWIAGYYAAACFLLFFLFGFMRLELSYFGMRVKRG